MDKFLYLIVDISVVSIPLLFTFHHRIRFDKTWKQFLPAILTSAGLFVIWDIIFTHEQVWGFNPRYITGLNILNVPIEEILFFICVPYACMFTYYFLRLRYYEKLSGKDVTSISVFLTLLIAALLIIFHSKVYTLITCSTLLILLLVNAFIDKKDWLALFYLTYVIILIPFFISNGILTGTGPENAIVWYNNAENTNLRILTIPLDDFFYAMLLMMMNVSFYEWLMTKKEGLS